MAAPAETTDWGQVSVLDWQAQTLQVRQLGRHGNPPLVLIHGFAAAAGHWRANAPAFAAAGWCVYGVDLLGFGDSAQPFLVQDNRTWAQQVLHLIEQRIQEPVVIVGHSLGALVGLTAAVSRPELVKALVLAPLQDVFNIHVLIPVFAVCAAHKKGQRSVFPCLFTPIVGRPIEP